MIYQLRLPKTMGVDGLFTNMVRDIEQAMGKHLPLEMQGAVARDLEKHLMAFDTCGCSSLCDEATVPSRWNTHYEPFLLSDKPEDHDKVVRLHLNLPGDSMDRLVGGLARYLDGQLEGADAERREETAAAIFNALAPYTFYGEVCRKIDLCKSAEQLPVNIKTPTQAA